MRRLGLALACWGLFQGQLFAQCGWVLWEKMTDTEGQTFQDTVTWSPQDGFGTLESCQQAGARLIAGWARVARGQDEKAVTTARDVRWRSRTQPRVLVTSVEYGCFPGGFDPRPLHR